MAKGPASIARMLLLSIAVGSGAGRQMPNSAGMVTNGNQIWCMVALRPSKQMEYFVVLPQLVCSRADILVQRHN